MNIAIYSPKKGFQGGVERYAYEVAQALRARHHRVVLLHDDLAGADEVRFLSGFDDAARIAECKRVGPFDVVYAQKAIDAAARSQFGNPRVVVAAHDHAQTCVREHRYLPFDRSPCHRAPGAACITHGCAVVRDREHDTFHLLSPFALRRRTIAAARSSIHVACSQYIADRLVDAGVARSQVVVVHPVPTEVNAPIAPRPTSMRLLFVGQLVRGKGVEHAINAMQYLPPDAQLDIVGDGPSRAELELLTSSNTQGRIVFHGYVAADKVAQHYDACSIVVVPSHWPEPFGMIGIEAMRRGRPVVGAAHGGIPEWLLDGEAGRLFMPGNPRSLAHAMRRVHADPTAGERALAHVTRAFSHSKFVDAIERVLTSSPMKAVA